MQLGRSSTARTWVVGCILAGLGSAAAQERQQVDIHGYYYKETSTRVLQPRVEVSAEIPGARGGSFRAHYLLDAITSASVAAGASRDSTLTEFRNEVGLAAIKPLGPAALSINYIRSRESDYDSDVLGGAASLDLFEKNTTLTLGYAHIFDSVFSRVRRVREGALGTDLLSFYVIQLLSPVTVGSLGFELALSDGYQQNPYRGVNVGGGVLPELEPRERNRYTLAGRIAHLLPVSGTTLQMLYRFYTDSWQLHAHTLEFRVYQDIFAWLDARLSYRFHTQGNAYFAKPTYVLDPIAPTRSDAFYTSDPKLFGFDSHYVELQARFALAGLSEVPVLGWIAAGTLDLTVGFLYMGSRFGNCGPLDPTSQCQNRIIALGITLPL